MSPKVSLFWPKNKASGLKSILNDCSTLGRKAKILIFRQYDSVSSEKLQPK